MESVLRKIVGNSLLWVMAACSGSMTNCSGSIASKQKQLDVSIGSDSGKVSGDAKAGGDVGTAKGNRTINHTCTDLAAIPASAIEQAKEKLVVRYDHTSHGSHLWTGMNYLIWAISLNT